MSARHAITINCLIESTNLDGITKRIRRVLFLDERAERICLIDLRERIRGERGHPMPEWEAVAAIGEGLKSGSMRVVEEDPWYADTRPDDELSKASLKTRASRWAVIAPLVDLDADPDQLILHARHRGAMVEDAHAATNVALDTIYDWLRLWWRGGQTENALLPKFERCGKSLDGEPRTPGGRKRGRPSIGTKLAGEHPGMNIDVATRQKLIAGGKRFYNRKFGKRTLGWKEAYDRTLAAFFAKRIEIRDDGTRVPITWEGKGDDGSFPTLNQFQYWVTWARNELETSIARHGARRHALENRAVMGTSQHLSMGPGDLYLIDATIVDLYVLSSIDRRRVVGRPVLYFVVDHFSLMIVGFYVGWEGPNWMGALMALENACTDKVSFCARYGIKIEDHEWPCHHVPRKLTGDRGELISKASDWTVPGLNLTLKNTPPFRADFKSFVEGYFKILNEKVIERIPGWVDQHRDRGDPDYRYDATLTLPAFTKLMIEMILHNNRARKVNQVPVNYPRSMDYHPNPLDLWEWGITNTIGAGRVLPREKVRVGLLPRYPARSSYEGLGILGGLLRYESADAQAQGWFQRGTGRKSKTCNLFLDERDVSVAYRRLPHGEIEECPLTPASAVHFKGKSLTEVLDDQDREKIGSARTRNRDVQERLNLAAKVDHIVEQERGETKRASGGANRKPDITDIKSTKALEKQQNRKEQKFTPPSQAVQVPSYKSSAPPANDDDYDAYVPF